MAAVLACGPDAVLSHRSAAYLWGLVDEWEEPIDVTAPNRRGRSPDGSRRASRWVASADRQDDAPRRSPARASPGRMLDFAGVAPEWEVRRVVAQAEVLRILDSRSMRALLKREPATARRRSAASRSSTRSIRRRRGRASELERLFLEMCVEARRSRSPRSTSGSTSPDGKRYQADFLWRDARLIVEADSRRFHDTDSRLRLRPQAPAATRTGRLARLPLYLGGGRTRTSPPRPSHHRAGLVLSLTAPRLMGRKLPISASFRPINTEVGLLGGFLFLGLEGGEEAGVVFGVGEEGGAADLRGQGCGACWG